MEAQKSDEDPAALYAQREARKAQQKAAKKERLLKKGGTPQRASSSGSQKKQQGQKSSATGQKPSILPGGNQMRNAAVKGSENGSTDEYPPVDSSKEFSEPNSGWYRLPTVKQQQEKSLASLLIPLPSQNRPAPNRQEQEETLHQLHIKALTPYELDARTEELRDRRGYNQRPTGVFKPGERASSAPRRLTGEPPLEQKHPFDEMKDPIGQDYSAYKAAHDEYILANRAYKKARLELSHLEDPSYKRYAGKHLVKVERARKVEGKRTLVVVEEERDYPFLTPPTHQKLALYVEDIIDAAERTLRLRREFESKHCGRCYPTTASRDGHMAQFKDLEDAIREKKLLLEDHRKQAQQPHQLDPRKIPAGGKTEASPSESRPATAGERSGPNTARATSSNTPRTASPNKPRTASPNTPGTTGRKPMVPRLDTSSILQGPISSSPFSRTLQNTKNSPSSSTSSATTPRSRAPMKQRPIREGTFTGKRTGSSSSPQRKAAVSDEDTPRDIFSSVRFMP